MKRYGVGKHQLNARQLLRRIRSMAPKSTQRIHGERRSGHNGASQPIFGMIQAVKVDLRFCVESNSLTYDAPSFMARWSSIPIWCRVQKPQAGPEICSRSCIFISFPQLATNLFYRVLHQKETANYPSGADDVPWKVLKFRKRYDYSKHQTGTCDEEL